MSPPITKNVFSLFPVRTDGDGTRFLADNGQYVVVSGGGIGLTSVGIVSTVAGEFVIVNSPLTSNGDIELEIGTIGQAKVTDLVSDLANRLLISTYDTFRNGVAQLGTLAGIDDAPNDGQQYARQSNAWAVVTGGGGGSLSSVGLDAIAPTELIIGNSPLTSDGAMTIAVGTIPQSKVTNLDTDLSTITTDISTNTTDIAARLLISTYDTFRNGITQLGTLAGIDDAPNDGQQYVRQSENWAVVSGGGSLSSVGLVAAIAPEFVITNTPLTSDGNITIEIGAIAQSKITNLTTDLAAKQDNLNFSGNSNEYLDGQGNFTVPPDTGLTSVGLDAIAPAELIIGNSPLTSNGNLTIAVGVIPQSKVTDLESDLLTIQGDIANNTTQINTNTQNISDNVADIADRLLITTFDTFRNSVVQLGSLAAVDDAPNDGQQYARQSQGWSVVAGGSSTPVNFFARYHSQFEYFVTSGQTLTLDAGTANVNGTVLEWLSPLSVVGTNGVAPFDADKVFYVYLFDSGGGTATLELSETVPVFNTTNLAYYKTGDNTRRLVASSYYELGAGIRTSVVQNTGNAITVGFVEGLGGLRQPLALTSTGSPIDVSDILPSNIFMVKVEMRTQSVTEDANGQVEFLLGVTSFNSTAFPANRARLGTSNPGGVPNQRTFFPPLLMPMSQSSTIYFFLTTFVGTVNTAGIVLNTWIYTI